MGRRSASPLSPQAALLICRPGRLRSTSPCANAVFRGRLLYHQKPCQACPKYLTGHWLATGKMRIVMQSRPSNLIYSSPMCILTGRGPEATLSTPCRQDPILVNVVKSVQGNDLSFLVTPALPPGLSLCSHTGTISGWAQSTKPFHEASFA